MWVLSSPLLPLGPAELGAPQSTLLSQPVALPAQVSQMQVSLHRWGSGHPHCGLGQLSAGQRWLCLSRPHPGAPSHPVLTRPEWEGVCYRVSVCGLLECLRAAVCACLLFFCFLITHQACITKLVLLPAEELSVYHLELQMG